MLDLWSALIAEFKQQSLLAQLSFILPFIGLPTLIGVVSNWSTKARLRKLADGRAAEIELLTVERDELKAASFHNSLADADASEEAYATADFEAVFRRNKRDILLICENLANERVILWWETGLQSDRSEALYFAGIATAMAPDSLIGQTILAIAFDDAIAAKALDASSSLLLSGGESDPQLVERVIGIISQKCTELTEKGMHRDVILYARYSLVYVRSQGDVCSPAGYNALYWLVVGLINIHRGKIIRKEDRIELKSAARYFVDIVEAAFPDRNHLAQFVSKFHYASALHMVDEGAEALSVLEDENLPGRVSQCVGPESSACFATRHLYANLLYEKHRPEEAQEIIAALTNDLSSAGKLSKGHVQTYRRWNELSQSRQYKRGDWVRFQNTTNFTY
jgi:hypothetical protein